MDTKSEAPQNVNEVMAQMLAVALASGHHPERTFMFTLPAAHVFYRSIGTDMNADFHDTICPHRRGRQRAARPASQGRHLRHAGAGDVPQLPVDDDRGGGDRPRQHRSSTSRPAPAWGKVHDTSEWPVLLLGKAGGALKGDQHFRFANGNLSSALLTIANIFGAKLTTIGKGDGQTSRSSPGCGSRDTAGHDRDEPVRSGERRALASACSLIRPGVLTGSGCMSSGAGGGAGGRGGSSAGAAGQGGTTRNGRGQSERRHARRAATRRGPAASRDGAVQRAGAAGDGTAAAAREGTEPGGAWQRQGRAGGAAGTRGLGRRWRWGGGGGQAGGGAAGERPARATRAAAARFSTASRFSSLAFPPRRLAQVARATRTPRTS